eukprot:Pgem_evm3s3149
MKKYLQHIPISVFEIKAKGVVGGDYNKVSSRARYSTMASDYIGYDTSLDAIHYAQQNFKIENYLKNSLIAEIPAHEAVITCPPYWNLEKYKSKEGLDQIKTYKEFLSQYKKLWQRVTEKANPNSTYFIIVGDYRKNHVYYDIS